MRTHTHRFVAELNRIAGETYNSLFTLQQLRGIAGDMGLRIDGFEDFLDSLNTHTRIHSPTHPHSLTHSLTCAHTHTGLLLS